MYNFQSPFAPAYTPFAQNFNPVQASGQPMQVVRVNGRNGAEAYGLGPNSSALLLDEGGTLVWLVTSDGAGYKTVAAYDIVPHKEQPAKEYTDLETRVKRLEDMIGGRRNGNTGNSPAAGKKPAGDGAD